MRGLERVAEHAGVLLVDDEHGEPAWVRGAGAGVLGGASLGARARAGRPGAPAPAPPHLGTVRACGAGIGTMGASTGAGTSCTSELGLRVVK